MRAPAPPRPANPNGSRKTNGSHLVVFIADNRRAVNAALSPCFVFAYWVLWKIMLVPIWGKLSMNTYIALLPIPLIILVCWVPVIWASLRRIVRDSYRLLFHHRGGQYPNKPRPLIALLGLLAASFFAWYFAYAPTMGYSAQLADLREGPTLHYHVTCQDMGKRVIRNPSIPYTDTELSFTLSGPNNYSQTFTAMASDLKVLDRNGTNPYATVLSACQSPDTTLTVSIYPRTGIIAEASVRQ